MEAGGNLRVLVVDDSDFSRNNIAKMLENTRYNVIGEAANAKEAINILKDRKAHIAIVDVVMPEISGIELADKLTSMFNDINIVMISSLAQENIIMDSISAGAADFLQKPFDKATLLGSLGKIASTIEED
ncbi:MAG: response regulator [Bacteriovoracaceae bacterium]|nr:response regulator [Bacteriovoracaceae bacterium]